MGWWAWIEGELWKYRGFPRRDPDKFPKVRLQMEGPPALQVPVESKSIRAQQDAAQLPWPTKKEGKIYIFQSFIIFRFTAFGIHAH